MSGLFSSKKQTPDFSTVYDPYAGIRGQSSSWLQSQIGKTAPAYEGEMVAPLSEQENQSFDYLNKYVTQQPSESTQLARNEIKKTLTGQYDPTTSPYYQSVKAEAARNLQDSLSGISSDAAGGGRYWSGARLAQQGEARTDVANALNTLLGQMSENERARRLTAAQQAQSLGQEETALPLQQATALQGLGALPRENQQAYNEAAYNEWLRQQQYPLQIAQLASPYATYSPTVAETGYTPSTFSQIAPYLGAAAGSLLGPVGSAAGGALANWLFSKKS